jgi:hypothetical protein
MKLSHPGSLPTLANEDTQLLSIDPGHEQYTSVTATSDNATVLPNDAAILSVAIGTTNRHDQSGSERPEPRMSPFTINRSVVHQQDLWLP